MDRDIARIAIAEHRLDPLKPVALVRVVRLEFEPGQTTPLHLHQMPVVGYVEQGSFIVQVEGEEPVRYETGQSVFEPANARIARFDNASRAEPAVLIALYLAGAGEDKLIQLLEP